MDKFWTDGPAVTTDLFNHIVQQRNIDSNFIDPKWPDHLHDPFLLPDMDKAIERFLHAVKKGETVGIVGDYDMDGTPAAVLLSEFCSLLKVPYEVILPTRFDGYGFSEQFVDRLKSKKVSLIFTVDCGIRDFAPVEHAVKNSIDVIILDHHECSTSLPNALAVIDAKRPDSVYPFRELCGTGVVYKFIQAFLQRHPDSLPKYATNWLAWSLDLVALATIGDMVPLVDENRLLVTYGMKVINRGHRMGLQRFITSLELHPATVSYEDIAFKIIPKLNASGRIDSMDDVFLLLTSSDGKEVDSVIKRILTRNTQRQLLSTTVYSQAKQRFFSESLPSVLVAYDPSWHPGVTGLVASRLAEEYNRPVAVLGSLEGSGFRGSMRGVGGVSLPELLTQVETHIERFGGHEEAAGLSVSPEKIEEFKKSIESLRVDVSQIKNITTDGLVLPQFLSLLHLESLMKLTPWGMGHPEPKWSLIDIQLFDPRWIGENKNHLKARIMTSNGEVDVICFGAERYKECNFARRVDIYGVLSINEFRGTRKPQLLVKGLAYSA